MGNQCVGKATDMLGTIFVFAHEKSQNLYSQILSGKDFSYRSAPMKDIDYENGILLDEDDECAFEYEECNIPNILTNDDI